MPIRMRFLGLALAAALPVAAHAQQTLVNRSANLRAGPAASYPVLAQLVPGTAVDVAGCTAGYQWCDVVLPGGGLRGWVFAQNLSTPYQGQPVPLAQYGATIGLPLLTFALGSYWGSHYRDRPFYRDQRYWRDAAPPSRPEMPRPGFGGRQSQQSPPPWHPDARLGGRGGPPARSEGPRQSRSGAGAGEVPHWNRDIGGGGEQGGGGHRGR